MEILGLPIKETKQNVELLNTLLANFQIYYQSLRALHWNIRGKRFFDLHLKFEELYNNAQLRIDGLAERVLTLGGVPLHTFEDYMKRNQLEIGYQISEDEKAVELIINSLSKLLILEREILETASAINDEGTTSMMSDLIVEQEKEIWMMKAFLG